MLMMCLTTIALTVQGQEPSFKVAVSGKGTPLLLIPGLACSGDVWETTVDSLKDRYECHVLTLPGFAGQPAIDHENRYLEKVKGEILSYLDNQDLQQIGLIGHSLGGFLALQLAAEHSGRFNALVIVDGLPFLPAMQVPGITAEGAKPMIPKT